MRRLLLVSVLLLGSLSAVALGASGHAAKTFPATGILKSLTASSLTIHGRSDVTCRLTPSSPATAGLGIGDRVKVACAGGILVRILRFGSAAPVSTVPASDANAAASPTTASAAGAITSLVASSITVTGDRALTCALNSDSPSLSGYHVGDHVKIGCANGSLVGVAKVSTTPPTPAPTPAPTTTTTAGGSGAITALSPDSITVTGDRSLTCAIKTNVTGLSSFQTGDAVRIGCVNGVLYYIVAATPPTTTTTTPAPTPTTYGIGTISALTTSTVTVTGAGTLSCELASTSPSLGDYHVGDPVEIACQNQILVGIGRNTTVAPPAPATAQAGTSGKGTITALSASSITVTGDQSLTCSIGASSPAPSAYGLTVGAHVGIACQNGVLTHLSSV